MSAPRATSAFEPALWHSPDRLVRFRSEGISGENFCVPEGVVHVIRCRRCGGRDEHLSLYQPGASDEDALRDRQLAGARHADFGARHDQCAITPRVHRPLATVGAFSEYLIAEATEILRTGPLCQYE